MKIKNKLFLIFLLALLLRVVFIIFYDHGKMLQNQLYAPDEYSYDQIAVNFLNGKGLVTDDGLYARRGPVYPLFLAIIYFIFGHSYVAVRFIQAIIGSSTPLLIFFITRKLVCIEIAIIASWLSLLYYPFIYQPAYLSNEILFTFSLAILIFLLIKFATDSSLLNLFSAAILFGLTVLCREVILYFMVFIFIWLLIIRKRLNLSFLKLFFIFSLGIIVSMAPWTLRNFFIFKSWVPTTVSSGHSLFLGNNPTATGGSGGWFVVGKDADFPDDIKKLFTPESERILKRAAFDFILTHPFRFIYLSLKRFVNMWRPYYSNARLINKLIMSFTYMPILIFAIIGLLKYRFSSYQWILIYFLIFYYIIIHIVTITEIRYRYALMPYIIIFASLPISSLLGINFKKG